MANRVSLARGVRGHSDLPLWSSTKSVEMTKKISILEKKIGMTKETIKETLSHSWKKSVFCQILRKKICILPNFKEENLYFAKF